MERRTSLSPESQRHIPLLDYERVYLDPSTKWIGLVRPGEPSEGPIYGKIKSPYTRVYGTPRKFSEMYNKNEYNGKFNLLVDMMKNKKKTINEIASLYQ